MVYKIAYYHDRKIHHRESEATLAATAKPIVQAWSNSELVLTSGLGHERILQEPKVIEQTVAFIQSSTC